MLRIFNDKLNNKRKYCCLANKLAKLHGIVIIV